MWTTVLELELELKLEPDPPSRLAGAGAGQDGTAPQHRVEKKSWVKMGESLKGLEISTIFRTRS